MRTKEFDQNKALSGEKMVTRDGRPVACVLSMIDLSELLNMPALRLKSGTGYFSKHKDIKDIGCVEDLRLLVILEDNTVYWISAKDGRCSRSADNDILMVAKPAIHYLLPYPFVYQLFVNVEESAIVSSTHIVFPTKQDAMIFCKNKDIDSSSIIEMNI